MTSRPWPPAGDGGGLLQGGGAALREPVVLVLEGGAVGA